MSKDKEFEFEIQKGNHHSKNTVGWLKGEIEKTQELAKPSLK